MGVKQELVYIYRQALRLDDPDCDSVGEAFNLMVAKMRHLAANGQSRCMVTGFPHLEPEQYQQLLQRLRDEGLKVREHGEEYAASVNWIDNCMAVLS